MKLIFLLLLVFLMLHGATLAQDAVAESKSGGWAKKASTSTDDFPPTDVDVNIPENASPNPNALAIVFGVENYKSVAKVPFARRDAKIFKEYTTKVLGVPAENVFFKLDDEITRSTFNTVFSKGGWLSKRVQAGSDVFIYFAGHGAPDPKDKRAYLIPYDTDGNYIAQAGYPLDELYAELGKLKARSVTVFLDACFSGELAEGKRSLPMSIEQPDVKGNKLVVFSAASGTQTSSPYLEKGHGIFTYYLLQGLRGDAAGADKKLTMEELSTFVTENVKKTAAKLDTEQTPELKGKAKSRVLVKVK
jgi:hypothetical protein